MAAAEPIGISMIDRLKKLRSDNQRRGALGEMSVGQLTELLAAEEQKLEKLKASGLRGTDTQKYIVSITRELARKQPQKYAALFEGMMALFEAEKRRQSDEDSDDNISEQCVAVGAPLVIQPVDAEVLEDIAALVDTLTALQNEVKLEFAQFAAENKSSPEVRTFENQLKEMSRVRAVLTQHAADLHADEKGTKDYDEIGVHVHEAINLAQDEFLGLSRVGISILDRIKNLRARYQKTRALKLMKDGALLDMFRQQVQTAETLRGAGNNATDNVNYALNIREEIRRRDVPLTPEIVDLVTRLNTLQVINVFF